jgi:hypothetical protein
MDGSLMIGSIVLNVFLIVMVFILGTGLDEARKEVKQLKDWLSQKDIWLDFYRKSRRRWMHSYWHLQTEQS